MKNLLLPIILLFIIQFGNAQVFVEDVNINEIENLKMIRIVAKGSLFRSDVKIAVDYGQERSFLKKLKNNIKDENGETVKFASTIEALNFLENRGWEYIDSYVITEESSFSGKSNVYNYTFRKK